MKKLAAILIVSLVLSASCIKEPDSFSQTTTSIEPSYTTESSTTTQTTFHPFSSKKTRIWIEVHDVSPAWELWRLEEILAITDRHPGSYSKIVLFLIPNHANETPLSEYPEFVERLKILQEKGTIIGLHGYTHIIDPPEMNVSLDVSKSLINAAKLELEKSGLAMPGYFAPPAWITSAETGDYLESNFNYVYYADRIKVPGDVKHYVSHEYTWNEHNASNAMDRAQKDFKKSEEVFRLTIHVGAVNTPAGLSFLEDFLNWIEKQNI